MKINFKKVIISASVLLVLVIAALFCILSIANSKPVAAFYGIPETVRKPMIEVLQTTAERKNGKEPYRIVILDDSLSLKDALKHQKKTAVLFIEHGLNFDYAVSLSEKKSRGLSPDLSNGMSSSINELIPRYKNKIYAVPLLTDHYEIDVNMSCLNSSGMKYISILPDLEKYLKIESSDRRNALLFGAADDKTLVDSCGAFLEVLSGKTAVDSAAEKISAFTNWSNKSETGSLVADLLSESGVLYSLKKYFSVLKKQNILHESVFNNNCFDVKLTIEENNPPAVLMKFSDHRQINRDKISGYSSIFIPSTDVSQKRNLTAPVIFAVPLSKNKTAADSIIQLSNQLQTKLSTVTGLAPVQKQCGVQDKQAGDVRFWITASNAPLPGLSNQAFTNSKDLSAFAKELRAQISQ